MSLICDILPFCLSLWQNIARIIDRLEFAYFFVGFTCINDKFVIKLIALDGACKHCDVASWNSRPSNSMFDLHNQRFT
jgi:hypothetical protein